MKAFYVYILASKARGTLYVGVTSNLERRYFEHSTEQHAGSFTQKYKVKRLVYFEMCDTAEQAITREKQFKNWRRQWKINLIESINPKWDDLSKRYGIDAETSSA
jgi:putative endonuclease